MPQGLTPQQLPPFARFGAPLAYSRPDGFAVRDPHAALSAGGSAG
ncbi:MAG: hypothetical protein WD851_21235 [Pirellulales bacterium]